MDFASKTRTAAPPTATAGRAMTDLSPRGQQLRQLQAQLQRRGMASPAVQRATTDEEELLQGRFATAQRAMVDEDELLQGLFAPVQRNASEPLQRAYAEPAANRTGLPDTLKSGVEAMSGIALDAVRVHYNSPEPAQLNAHAFAQGTDIHLAPGQERHLPHEAWHVVQQAQGRVKPTRQLKGSVPINDDSALEREADIMGAQALQRSAFLVTPKRPARAAQRATAAIVPAQRVVNGPIPGFQIHTPAALSPAADARLNAAASALTQAVDNDVAVQINLIIISVEAEGGPDRVGGISTIAGDNPAETRTVAHPPGHPDIEITLQRPFAEAATTGELLGMLAHEVGAHNIPDLHNVADGNQNAWLPVMTPHKTQVNDTASGGYEFDPWPIGHGPPLAARDGNRQHDHVVAGQIANAPLVPGAVAATRGEIYFETVLNIGDAIWGNAAISLAERQTQTTELIHLFLVDIARIVATDDGRLPVKDNKVAVSDVYGEVFTNVVLPHQAAHPWIPNARPKANVVSLGLSLAAFVGKVKWEKYWRG